jgi:chitinase
VQAARTATDAGSRRVVGYFPIWDRNSGYSPNDVDWAIVTTIAHFSLTPHGDGSIAIPDWGPFPDPDLLARSHAAGASVVLVIGGDHAAATAGFTALAANPHARAAFVRTLLTLVDDNGYDGVDLDWEFPNSAADRANYAALVGEVRAALGWDRTLSITGPATDWWGQWFDLDALLPNVDWIGAMTYALSGPSWSQHADHSSALYSSADGEPSMDATTRYYLGRGVPGEKLLVGLPFYGERFDDVSALHQLLGGRDGGAIDYPDVTKLVNNGWTEERDPVAQVPYLVHANGAGVISFDDASSIQAKCSYIDAAGIGGAIIWHLGKDMVGGAQPLLEAAAGCR